MSPSRSRQLIIDTLAWMDRTGVKQKDLAETLGITPQQMNDILKGRTQLTGEQALHLQEIIKKIR